MHVEKRRLHCQVFLRLKTNPIKCSRQGWGGGRGNDKSEEESASILGEKKKSIKCYEK